ncbi:bifunctional methylenetetrahydrofolate dehydrogenase/methenyltetrahydrofolate cyclohydrolase FolD [Vampirovibrio chlorellavorus]|uniref:bifunctional methylenetetrahydrofolate dehydrogenase/methenyltetrahydrofolate cyclohydrolase FolD n=1 Tax=Vampirovibrio chlorellavorus TaxID=758823 RepID=UPI0026F1D54E|nr:bifunctional methylenetetrahydrofolate dehydrogenase/methenyltetrahydrofolate cyclohydrolase FolD [Vampirovibrio chlorellavorus]
MTSPATACILDGKLTSRNLLDSLSLELAQLKAQGLSLPKLVVVLVGDDPASQVYVGKKAKTAQKIGMLSELLTYPAEISQTELLSVIARLNQDASVQGILVQLPLPRHIDTLSVIRAIDPKKDVDGLHPLNMGLLMSGDPSACKPCTPAGVMTLLKAYNVPLAGKNAVVLGRSNIVGKPMGLLLLQENATVTYCHSKTADLPAVCREADILVAAVGVPNLVTADFIKPGAAVIDVGINRLDGKLVGDVDFASASQKAGFITPVPGGVGPMTIATLMANTLFLYRQGQRNA